MLSRKSFLLLEGAGTFSTQLMWCSLRKKRRATAIGDYGTINIMHSMPKLLAKILANRLAPHLNSLVSHSQSVFIKGISIHDYHLYLYSYDPLSHSLHMYGIYISIQSGHVMSASL
jgi:hypothetical protein